MNEWPILALLEIAALLLPCRNDQRPWGPDPVAQNVAFRRALRACPVCDGGLGRHAYALLASTRFDDDNHWDEALWHALSEQNWELMREFGCSTVGENLIEAYALRCSQSRRSAWFTLVFPVDETDLPFVSRVETLNFDATAELNAFVPAENWRPFT
jgi:hypothetical protein